MPPALGHHHGLTVGRQRQAVGEREAAGERPGRGPPDIHRPHGARGVALQEVAGPLARPPGGGPLRHQDRRVVQGQQGHGAGHARHGDRVGPPLGVDADEAAVVQAGQEPAGSETRQGRDGRVQGRDPLGAARAEVEPQQRGTARHDEAARPVPHDRVGRVDRGERLCLVEAGVRPERAVERRHRDGAAAEQVQQGVKQAHAVPSRNARPSSAGRGRRGAGARCGC